MNKAEQIERAEAKIVETIRTLVKVVQESDTDLELALCHLRQAKRLVRGSK